MGDKNNPVNIWQWKAGWQQEADGHRQDMTDSYPSMHVDTYFQPRAIAPPPTPDNVISQSPHVSPVEDANARGFGTFKSQPASGQNVSGKGIWRDGSWSVIFVRDLKSQGRGRREVRGRQAGAGRLRRLGWPEPRPQRPESGQQLAPTDSGDRKPRMT